MSLREAAARMIERITISLVMVLSLCFSASSVSADVNVQVTGPAGQGSELIPGSGGAFAVDLALAKNAVNTITVTATDGFGNKASQELSITQISFDSLVAAEVKAELLGPERVEELVNQGMIKLDNPANYNVSQFDIVLTIGNQTVPVSVPIALPLNEPEPVGWETYQMPSGDGGSGGRPPPPPIEIIVFEKLIEAVIPGQPSPPPIPGVIIIEGRIKSLKEFFSVKLLLMNLSGIFTLSDVTASLEFPNNGLASILPADGIASLGDILPGNGVVPGQKEKEFIIRGDEIGIRNIRVNFGGNVRGPGIPQDSPIAFNGSAQTSVEVKGPPTFLVQVIHPDFVEKDEPYELLVDVTNTGETPALYASLELDVGAAGKLVTCSVDAAGEPQCAEEESPETRSFGHIFPGDTARESFTIIPAKSGNISSCLGISDQNITLQVLVGTIGCLVGRFPPERKNADGSPAVSVLPTPNMLGVGLQAPVTAFFSEPMNQATITTGDNGTFNVYDEDENIVPGLIHFESLNDKTVVIWQPVQGQYLPNAEYSVWLGQGIVDLQGFSLASQWSSKFSTTGEASSDVTLPEISLAILPPINPNAVIPGQKVEVRAYASDQGSGLARIELRKKDLSIAQAGYELIDQKNVGAGDTAPFNFILDSANLVFGHTYQLLGTAFDVMGNTRETTLALVILPDAAPPAIVLPADDSIGTLRGVGISLKPEAVTGGVTEVRYYLDGSSQPFQTVTLAPYSASLATLNLSIGGHSIKAIVIDGLGQTGEDTYSFTLLENSNAPTVRMNSPAQGAEFVKGNTFVVSGAADDPTGVKSIKFYLDSTSAAPIAENVTSFPLNTSALSLGQHTVYIVATNNLDLSNSTAIAEASRTFGVINPPPEPPPGAPQVSSLSYPENGQVTIFGTTEASARVDITNTAFGMTVSAFAGSNGVFSASIDAEVGNQIDLVAFDPSQTNHGPKTTVIVQAAPVLDHIGVGPSPILLTDLDAHQDLTVAAHYAGGATANVTGQASFVSSNPAVASVGANGRVVPQANGQAVLTASFGGRQAQADVTVSVVVLTHITLSPAALSFAALNQTEQLIVTGHFSDGSAQELSSGLAFTTGNPVVATVTQSGVVTAKGSGITQVNVSRSGVPSVSLDVAVDLGVDSAPTVEILSPASGTDVERGEIVQVSVCARDLVGGVKAIVLETSGGYSYSESRQAGGALDITEQFTLNIPANAPVGSAINISVYAEDTAGNTSPVVLTSLDVVDKTAPSVSITEPANQAEYNFGDTVSVVIQASDAVGVSSIRYATSGALTLSGSKNVSGALNETATFSFDVPFGLTNPEVKIHAWARDEAGNEREAITVDIVITDADITPPETIATAISNPGSGATASVSYQVVSGLEDLDYIALFFRRNGIGAFNRYTNADGGNAEGRFTPQSGANGTILFDSTKMGGDGSYEFYTVGVDKAGNREAAPDDGSGGVLPDQTATFAAGMPVTVIDAPLVIGDGDASYDNQNLRIVGTTVTLAGHHSFHNVELLGGAKFTHPETSMSAEYGLDIAAWTLTIDSASAIDVSGRGYLGGLHEGNDCSGETFPGVTGSGQYAGGSYGGLGGAAGSNPANALYGLLTNPLELGSGGGCGTYSRLGGDGGGRIRLTAINLTSDGQILANGRAGENYSAGGGSGGSINIISSTLSGNGSFEANGGAWEVGGGGGRIAVFFVDMSTLSSGALEALGGDGSERDGGNGTVFLKGVAETNGTLVVDGQGNSTSFSTLPIPPGYVFDGIVLRNSAKVIADDPLVVNGELVLENNSVLTHTRGSTAGLNIQAESLVIDETSAIDVSEKGYRGGLQYGAPCEGETLGSVFAVPQYAGGSYGGLGNFKDNETNPAYGQASEPIYLGSGGGCGTYSRVGGMGGGRAAINLSEKLEVNGRISADGGISGDYSAGGGSGGSIRIVTSLLKGTGNITANGNALQVGGGGGRVAIYYDYVEASGEDLGGLRNITACGGHGSSLSGSAGTVLLRRNGQSFGDLYVDEQLAGSTSTRWTPLTLIGFGTIQALASDTITLDGRAAILPGALVGMEVNPNIAQGATFRVTANTANTITVEPLSAVSLASAAAAGDTYTGVNRFDNIYFRRGGWLVLGDQLIVEDTLKIAENGSLTHYDATLTFDSRLDVSAGTVEIAADAKIDVNERGLLGGLRNGNDCEGRTYSGLARSSQYSGGSYAGLGSGADPNPAYGSVTNPSHLGSGGGCGTYGRIGGDGGGWIHILAEEMIVDGVVMANGGVPGNYSAGGGSGGTVSLDVGELSGNGTIQANGGANQQSGGGGRISVTYDTLTFAQDRFQVLGGQGSDAKGGNGTLFLKSNSQTFGDLIIDGHDLSAANDKSPIPAGYTFDNVVLRNSALVLGDAPISIAGELRLESNSKLMHTRGLENGLQISAASVFVDSTSAIDVSGRGYRGGLRDGAPCEGETLGGLFAVRQYTGGSYGGLGGQRSDNPASIAYGNPAEPIYLGSGGGCGTYSRNGGHGGGRIDIATNGKVEVLGRIAADGYSGENYSAGSGSGGSIRITTPLFKGTGIVSANGGSGEAAGGGGRIAVFYGNLGSAGEDLDGLRSVVAQGGHSNAFGSAGTVLFKQTTQQFGDLYIDEGLISDLYKRWTPLTHVGFGKIKELTADTITTYGTVPYAPGGLVGLKINPDINQAVEFTIVSNTADSITVAPNGSQTLTDVAAVGDAYAGIYRFDNVQLRGGAFFVLGDKLLVGEELIVSEQSVLTHYDATLTSDSRLDVDAGYLEVTADSSIDVSGRGYLGGLREGNSCSGQTLPGLTGSAYQAAGSYGGLGVTYGNEPNAAYGTAANPAELGSGGGCGTYSRVGGDGGGWARIVAGEILLNGSILADGAPGGNYGAGGGSGGAINLDVENLTGAGAIKAEGARVPTELGGGGGRVAIRYNTCPFALTGVVSAAGGQGSSGVYGGNGSVYLEQR